MKEKSGKIKGLLVDLYTDVTSHWKKPAKGNFVTYKEMINYSIGGMGQQMLIMFIGYFGLGAANTLLGSTIGIRPMHLQNMVVIQQVINVFLYIFRGKIIDSTRTKWGRFRPYMLIASIPLLVLGVSFLFLDFASMSYNTKLGVVFGFAIAISSLSPMLTDTYTELATVITPNTRERAKFYSITSIVYSMAPTIFFFMIPMLSELTGGYTNINTYRYVIAPFAVIGFFLNMFVVFGCKEKVVTSKTYVQKVSTLKACTQIYRNKYWWIRTLASTLGFLEGAFNAIFMWTFMYQAQDMKTFAFLVTVQGTASLIAMLITPWILKKFGNRKTLLIHNIVNVMFITLMLFSFQVPGLFFVFLYLNTIVNQLQIVYGPVMHSEVKDYQHYVSGKRLDFTFGAAGQILLPITILSGYCLPLVYESLGLTTNYDIMYDPVMRNKLFGILCILSIIGATLNLIPYFFYRMTQAKHKMIVNVLHLRAGLEDYASGDITPQGVKAMIDGVNQYVEIMKCSDIDLKADKRAIKRAKDMPKSTDKEKQLRSIAIKAAREHYTFNEYMLELREGAIEIFKPEMEKYDSALMQAKVAVAQHIDALAVEDIIALNMSDIVIEVKGKNDKETSKIAKYIAKTEKAINKMKASIAKNYPDGIVANNREKLNVALEMPHETKDEDKARTAAIKVAEKEYNKYCNILSLYYDSKSIYKQYYSKQNFHEIEAMFEDSVKLIEDQEAAAAAEEQRIKRERREELDRLLTIRNASKKNKKSGKNSDSADICDIDVAGDSDSAAVEVEQIEVSDNANNVSNSIINDNSDSNITEIDGDDIKIENSDNEEETR